MVNVFKCTHCSKSFTTENDLTEHFETDHWGFSENGKDYQCKTCDESFTNEEILEKHIETCHITRNVNVCEHCQKEFSQSETLKNHEDIVHSSNHNCTSKNDSEEDASLLGSIRY